MVYIQLGNEKSFCERRCRHLGQYLSIGSHLVLSNMTAGFLCIRIDHQQHFTIAAFDFCFPLFVGKLMLPGGSRRLNFFPYRSAP
jgi:hypothetical protein